MLIHHSPMSMSSAFFPGTPPCTTPRLPPNYHRHAVAKPLFPPGIGYETGVRRGRRLNLQRIRGAAYAAPDRDTENNMPESVLTLEVARYVRMAPADVAAVLRGASDIVADRWRRGRRTHFPGLGTFEPVWRDSRIVSSNLPDRPKIHIRIPPRRSVKLKPTARLKEFDFAVGTAVETRPRRSPIVFG